MSQPTTNNNQPSTSHENEVLVRVNGVSKKFCRDLKKSLWYGVKDVAAELFPFGKQKSEIRDRRSDSSSLSSDLGPPTSDPGLRPGEFWAVKDVSFELRRGECLGLIGRNGAGKTTLLKMLNGLIKPDEGTIEMRGRVGALIALGAGFNPILSGRENVYVNGSILGLSKEEIDSKIEDIIDFAEIRDFIDSPVQSYSSGMQVRLGFAVATALDPDILILDEVLAVGDAAFRAKCYNRVVALRKKAAVIFVTHSMEQVARICDSTLLLSKGQIAFLGDVGEGVQRYDKINELGAEQDPYFISLHPPISAFKLKELLTVVQSGNPLKFGVEIETTAPLINFKIRISFYSSSGAIVAEVNQSSNDYNLSLHTGLNRMNIELPVAPLRHGTYRLGCNIIDQNGDLIVWSYKQFAVRIEGGDIGGCTECQIPVTSWQMI